MCWIGTTSNNIQTANQNISVYKVVKKIDENNCRSLYLNYKYTQNNNATSQFYVTDNDGERKITQGLHSYYGNVTTDFSPDRKYLYVYVNGNRVDAIKNNPDLTLARFIIPNGSHYYQNSSNEMVSDKIKFESYTNFEISILDPSTVLASDCGMTIYMSEVGSTIYNRTINTLEQGGTITSIEFERLTGMPFPILHPGGYVTIGMGLLAESPDDLEFACDLELIS